MNKTIKLCLASMLALSVATPVLAQNAQQGDYYRFQPWVPQQVGPAREQRIQQGDYYKTHQFKRQHLTSAQKRRNMQGDYYMSTRQPRQ
jgi:hypothetical protein